MPFLTRVNDLQPLRSEFNLVESPQIPDTDMASSSMVLRFLRLLVRLLRPKHVLEVGTFIGTSAMAIAKAMPPDGRLVTIEKYDHFHGIASENFRRNELAHRITPLLGDAFEIIPALPPSSSFDFIFLDGDKERYCDHVALLHPTPADGGLLAVDDALNATARTPKGKGVQRLLRSPWVSESFFSCLPPWATASSS